MTVRTIPKLLGGSHATRQQASVVPTPHPHTSLPPLHAVDTRHYPLGWTCGNWVVAPVGLQQGQGWQGGGRVGARPVLVPQECRYHAVQRSALPWHTRRLGGATVGHWRRPEQWGGGGGEGAPLSCPGHTALPLQVGSRHCAEARGGGSTT